MARAACKIIINDGVGALAKSIEKVLTHPLVRDKMLSSAHCDALIQRLANVDRAAYDPECCKMPEGGLRGILVELQNEGVITEEVFGPGGVYR
jgi:hypothetical protein